MTQAFILSPRYRLDDQSPWLEGIDPARNYWIAVNGDTSARVGIPGLSVSSFEEWKQNIFRFRNLQPGEEMEVVRVTRNCKLHCVSSNCYAIEGEILGAKVWHLFDRETLDSLLMTAHPDWQCASQDLDLGRKILTLSWEQAAVA